MYNISNLQGFAPVAQWIEQRIPNPCAACSIHAGGTNDFNGLTRDGLAPFHSV